MRNVIQQSVVLPARPEALFAMYLDATIHTGITGFPAVIDAKPGAEFNAFNGQLSGMILAVVEPHLIVQSWRSTKFNGDDPDSTLILTFVRGPGDQNGRIDLVHLDVPEHDYADVAAGWDKYYWGPWRTYLDRRSE